MRFGGWVAKKQIPFGNDRKKGNGKGKSKSNCKAKARATAKANADLSTALRSGRDDNAIPTGKQI